MNPKDIWTIQCLLEEYEDYTDALYAAADYCYTTNKDIHQSEEFVSEFKKAFIEVHGA